MKAVVCKRFGGPEVLELDEVDDPAVGPGQLLVEVKACAVNFPDLLMMEDRYQVKPGLPFVPGTEVAGIVREVGPGVDGFRTGDRVLGTTVKVGGLAELVNLRAETAVIVPEGPALVDAAGLIYGYGTAHYALKDRGQLQDGESLVVLGAAGAVGLPAVEIGRMLGARVIAAASSEEKLALCRARGADELINYSTGDLKSEMRELTNGTGADVVYDPVGGSYAEPAVRSTAWGGRYLVIGFAAGIPKIPLNLALLRGCSVVGVFWSSFVIREPEQARRSAAELVEWWQTGRLDPYTSATYPLDQAADGLRDIAERRSLGRVVVTP